MKDTKTVEERFDESFIQDMSWINEDPSGTRIKAFLLKEIEAAKATERERIVRLCKSMKDQINPLHADDHDPILMDRSDGFNEALVRVIHNITKEDGK